MTGSEVKALIRGNGLKCWEVAEAWGMNDGNFSRKMRRPFSEEDVQRLNIIINLLTASKTKKPPADL